jgi:S-adenosylmethionine/arginine decarboxylase-like enzyme
VIFHKHLLVNAKVSNPINTEEQGIAFLRDLVSKIDMKIIQGPFASYVNAEGNKGLTAMVMIETSHIAFHIWDEPEPALLQFDLYTCGTLDKDNVLQMLKSTFDIKFLEFVLFDREDGFEVEEEGFLTVSDL